MKVTVTVEVLGFKVSYTHSEELDEQNSMFVFDRKFDRGVAAAKDSVEDALFPAFKVSR